MKRYYAWSVYIAISVSGASAAEREPIVTGRGAHHRDWVHLVSSQASDGSVLLKTNRYTELGTGLHYQRAGEWIETKEVIDIVPGGALASQGPHQVGFPANINTPGAINFLTSDNKRLRSHVLGLAYTDSRTGRSVLIAEIKDAIGELIGENKILYRDAFSDLSADVRYTYRRAGFEQDIILRERPPAPEVFGLQKETTRLEVFTEFVESPDPVISQGYISETTDPVQRAAMVFPDFIDQELNFGVMRMVAGRAFPLGDESGVDGIPTGKTWELREGRRFLIEAIQYSAAEKELAALKNRGDERIKRTAGARRTFPAAPRQAKAETKKVIKTAALSATQPGFVIDYTLTSGMTNFVFAADTNYYVSSVCSLWGTNIIEGGTVVKFTNNTTLGQIRFQQGVECRTSPYRPAVFTSMHDDTIGAKIAGSTGNPFTNYTATLQFGGTVKTYFNLHDLRILHANRAFHGQLSSVDVSNCQVIHTAFAFKNSGGIWNLRNVLVSGAASLFSASGSFTNNAEHMTIHAVSNFLDSGLAAVRLTNSLLISVTNGVSYVGTCVETNLSDAGIFQTVGYGSFYLATNSPYRDVGTNTINSTLLASLRQRTTYPPVRLSNTIVLDTTLSPSILRDTDTPDLGYHYDPLDYLVSGLVITNAVLTLTNGVAVGIDYSSTNWGLILQNSKLISHGNPTNLNRFVRTHMVQERSSGNPLTRALVYDGYSSGDTNELRLRFTSFAQLVEDGYMLYSGYQFSALEWTHSAIYNPFLVVLTDGGNTLTCGLTNTLWERGSGQFGDTVTSASVTVHVRNNLFRNTAHHFFDGKSNWTVHDNLVDTSGLYDHGTTLTNGHNAYYTALTNLSGGFSNRFLTNLTYLVGPLGDYYQPTNSNLLGAGSTNANFVGLYHFTTTTNQVKETNSIVDIGLHYVALNGSGNPVDSDTDGVPDFYEDWSGNGSVNSGETDWQSATDLGLRIFITRPRNGSTLP